MRKTDAKNVFRRENIRMYHILTSTLRSIVQSELMLGFEVNRTDLSIRRIHHC